MPKCHVKQALTLAPLTSSTKPAPEELTERCDTVFNTFRHMYQGSWKSLLNGSESDYTDMRRMWMSVLQNYDLKIIQNVLKDLINSTEHAKFPPNVIQFNLLCRNMKRRTKEESKIVELHQEQPKSVPMPDEMRSFFNKIIKKVE